MWWKSAYLMECQNIIVIEDWFCISEVVACVDYMVYIGFKLKIHAYLLVCFFLDKLNYLRGILQGWCFRRDFHFVMRKLSIFSGYLQISY